MIFGVWLTRGKKVQMIISVINWLWPANTTGPTWMTTEKGRQSQQFTQEIVFSRWRAEFSSCWWFFSLLCKQPSGRRFSSSANFLPTTQAPPFLFHWRWIDFRLCGRTFYDKITRNLIILSNEIDFIKLSNILLNTFWAETTYHLAMIGKKNQMAVNMFYSKNQIIKNLCIF